MIKDKIKALETVKSLKEISASPDVDIIQCREEEVYDSGSLLRDTLPPFLLGFIGGVDVLVLYDYFSEFSINWINAPFLLKISLIISVLLLFILRKPRKTIPIIEIKTANEKLQKTLMELDEEIVSVYRDISNKEIFILKMNIPAKIYEM